MDTSSEVVATDTLGRRIAPRRRRTVAEKRAIVKESMTPGMSVAQVSRRHEVNANQIFGWRRMYQAGLLEGDGVKQASQLLPVKIEAARSKTVTSAHRRGAKPNSERAAPGLIRIELPGGRRVQVRGRVDAAVLAQVIAALVGR